MVNYISQYARLRREAKNSCAVLDAMKSTSTKISNTWHFQNLTFKNVLSFDVVSMSVDTNQMHIAKTIGASWYSIWKVIDRKVHAD
jgi:hypothetical protein